jgi:hypothetical protein
MAISSVARSGLTTFDKFQRVSAGFTGTRRIIVSGVSTRLYSDDGGATWTATTQSSFTSSGNNYPVTKNGRIYVLGVSNNAWQFSYDGLTWYPSTGYPGDANATPYFFGETANGEVAICSYYGSTRHHLLREVMGFNGTIGSFGVPWDISGIAIDNNGVVGPSSVWVWGFNSTTIAYSTNDGITWFTTNVGNLPLSIVWGRDKFLMPTQGSTTYLTTTTASLTSWTSRTFPTTPQSRSAVRFVNGLWLLGGTSGALFTSPDGITWTSRTSGAGSNTIFGFGFAAGVYIAVGAGGYIGTSPDGVTWTARTSGITTTLQTVGGI